MVNGCFGLLVFWISGIPENHQAFQVPKTEESENLYKLYVFRVM